MSDFKKISLTRTMLKTMRLYADAYLDVFEQAPNAGESPEKRALQKCRLWIKQELERRARGAALRQAKRTKAKRLAPPPYETD